MLTFTIGDLSFDVTRHVRVDGSRFPTPSSDYLGDYFVTVCRWQSAVVLREAVGFIGKKVQPIYENQGTAQNPVWVQIGAKRGGDFRSRFFGSIARRTGKIVRGQQLGKTYSEVTEADIASAGVALRRLLRGTFTDPVDLATFSIDDAARHLRDLDGALEEGDKPPGTTAVIDTDFDGSATSTGTQNLVGTSVDVGNETGLIRRAFFRFPLSSIAAGSTVTDSDLQFNISSETVEASEGIDVRSYNTDGAADPEADAAADKYTRCNGGGVSLITLVTNSVSGSQSLDLTATADAQIAANLASTVLYTSSMIGLLTDAGTDDRTIIESIENAGTDPATLTVVYTEPAAGTIPLRTLMGVGV